MDSCSTESLLLSKDEKTIAAVVDLVVAENVALDIHHNFHTEQHA